eukprot:6361649-Alexandrium_andersonii.AAC.1
MSASLVGSEMCIRDRNIQNRFKRSNLELRGPKNGLKIGIRSSRGVRSAPCFVEMPKSADERGDPRGWGGG